MESELGPWCAWLLSGNRSRGTVELRRYHVERFMKWCGATGAGVNVESVSAYLMSRQWSDSTRRSIRTSIGLWCEWRCRTRRARDNPVRELPSIIPNRRLPRPCPDEVISACLESASVRVRAMVRLAAEAGLRRAEIAGVRRDDFLRDLLGWSLVVHGKGGRDRVVPLTDVVWVAVQRQFEDGPKGYPYLFPSPLGRHLQPARVGELMSEALPEGWTAHTLRHRFATRAYLDSRDLLLVQQLLGHAKPETTAMYIGMDTVDARAVVSRVRLV